MLPTMMKCERCGEFLADSYEGYNAHMDHYHQGEISCHKCEIFWTRDIKVWQLHTQRCGNNPVIRTVVKQESKDERKRRLALRMEEKLGKEFFI